jgi:hypothetical protein
MIHNNRRNNAPDSIGEADRFQESEAAPPESAGVGYDD